MIFFRYHRYQNARKNEVMGIYQMVLRFPTELKEALKAAAEERGQTLTGLIKQILWEWVKREENQYDH